MPAIASAQITLGAQSEGPAQIGIMTWRDIPFRRIVRQRYDFSCGSAAVATLLTWQYGTPTTEDESFAAMWRTGDHKVIIKSGFSLLDMKHYLDGRGFHAEGYRISPKDLREAGQPMIVLVETNGFRHFVVVKGVHDDSVLIGDPIRGLMRVSMSDFVKIWKGVVLIVMEPPRNAKVSYNLASEWLPWSTAPLWTMRDHLIGDVTSNLPPVYQITPQIIVNAGGGIAP